MEKEIRKGRWLRRTLRVLGVLIVLFIIACFVFDHYVQFRKSDEEMRRSFAEAGVDARIGYYESGGRKMRYVSSGTDSLPTLLFRTRRSKAAFTSWRWTAPVMATRALAIPSLRSRSRRR
jgi:hypothetical protein